MMNRNSLYYLEHLDAFEVMETHIMDRVMQEYWQSNLDASGSFFGASTLYSIIQHQNERYKFDYELKNRFYKKKNFRTVQPHKLNFMVVRKSMEVRYFLEMVTFFILVLLIQFELIEYVKTYNEVQNNFNHLNGLEGEVEAGNITV